MEVPTIFTSQEEDDVSEQKAGPKEEPFMKFIKAETGLNVHG